METCRLICQLPVFATYFYILALPGPVLPRPQAALVPAVATCLGCSPVSNSFLPSSLLLRVVYYYLGLFLARAYLQ